MSVWAMLLGLLCACKCVCMIWYFEPFCELDSNIGEAHARMAEGSL